MELAVLKDSPKKQVVIQEFKEIEKDHGLITPDVVVDRARDTSSNLHHFFDWNDSSAGEKYRLAQARLLIQDIKVIVNERIVRKYHNIEIDVKGDKVSGYVSLETISRRRDFKEQLLKEALTQIETWKNKYESIEKLNGLIDEEKLQELQKEME